jgi:hypothetical protein
MNIDGRVLPRSIPILLSIESRSTRMGRLDWHEFIQKNTYGHQTDLLCYQYRSMVIINSTNVGNNAFQKLSQWKDAFRLVFWGQKKPAVTKRREHESAIEEISNVKIHTNGMLKSRKWCKNEGQ